MKQENVPTLVRVTKWFLAPISPLQYILDSPGLTHVHCLEQAYVVLANDDKQNVVSFFRPYHANLRKGLLWADRGWKNFCHYYTRQGNPGTVHWPGAVAEAQYYFNKALALMPIHVYKGMFYLGASLHLIQDMCVPHHSVGSIFDGHQEFEKWASEHWQDFSVTHEGWYLPFTHPAQWVEHNAEISAKYYPFVSSQAGCNETTYAKAAAGLIPLTIRTTAGFLNFAKQQLKGIPLGLSNSLDFLEGACHG